MTLYVAWCCMASTWPLQSYQVWRDNMDDCYCSHKMQCVCKGNFRRCLDGIYLQSAGGRVYQLSLGHSSRKRCPYIICIISIWIILVMCVIYESKHISWITLRRSLRIALLFENKRNVIAFSLTISVFKNIKYIFSKDKFILTGDWEIHVAYHV